MTQTEKALQSIDLCARLHYGVKIHIESCGEIWDDILDSISIGKAGSTTITYINRTVILENCICKLYLRPLSSMTEEEMEELEKITYHTFKYKKGDCEIWTNSYHRVQLFNGAGELYGAGEPTNMLCSSSICIKLIDWLNAHHFDYRGLIEKGLALKAPKGMYE